jgi:hypothetical protein
MLSIGPPADALLFAHAHACKHKFANVLVGYGWKGTLLAWSGFVPLHMLFQMLIFLFIFCEKHIIFIRFSQHLQFLTSDCHVYECDL